MVEKRGPTHAPYRYPWPRPTGDRHFSQKQLAPLVSVIRPWPFRNIDHYALCCHFGPRANPNAAVRGSLLLVRLGYANLPRKLDRSVSTVPTRRRNRHFATSEVATERLPVRALRRKRFAFVRSPGRSLHTDSAQRRELLTHGATKAQ